MKKLLFFFLTILLTSNIWAQPSLSWGTYYYGTIGPAQEWGNSIARDANGNIYLAGWTRSTTGISTAGSHQSTFGGGSGDAFLVKFNSSGVRQWATYYGGLDDEYGNSVTVDANGNVYLAGQTQSTSGISTAGSHQPTFGGGSDDAFLVKFNSLGVRQWATYYGGVVDDAGNSVTVDASGNVYLTGLTDSVPSSAIATLGSHQPTYGGGIMDAFLVKFNSSGVRQWATYYGGSDWEGSPSVAADTSGNIYLSGRSASSTNISTLGSHQPTYGGGTDAFLVKFNNLGVRQWATYYGGTGSGGGNSIAVVRNGNVYLTGWTTSSTNISTLGSHQPANSGGSGDAFLVKFNSSGTRQWATYYGGAGIDQGSYVAADTSGNAYLTGWTNSSNAISTSGSHQPTLAGFSDAFLVKFNSSGLRQWATYYGGAGFDTGESVAAVGNGSVYLAGTTGSPSGISTAGSHQPSPGGSDDAFLVYFDVTLGILESNIKSDVNVYPNPFSFQTFLHTGIPLKNATLTIYNSFGQALKQIKNISGQTITLHRDNLPSGLYFVHLTQENKIITSKKIVITDK